MNREVLIRNRHSRLRVSAPRLRQIILTLLDEVVPASSVELGVTLVDRAEMAGVNWQFLRHKGSTDVITFDHSETQTSRHRGPKSDRPISGEIYICLDEARVQAQEFGTGWREEVVRYLVHGTLHLQGYDDHSSPDRRAMKTAENRLLHFLAKRFDFNWLAGAKR